MGQKVPVTREMVDKREVVFRAKESTQQLHHSAHRHKCTARVSKGTKWWSVAVGVQAFCCPPTPPFATNWTLAGTGMSAATSQRNHAPLRHRQGTATAPPGDAMADVTDQPTTAAAADTVCKTSKKTPPK